MRAEAGRVVQLRIEGHGKELAGPADGVARKPELFLHVAEIVPVVRVVPGVVREDHAAAHVADLGARGGIERDGRLVVHAEAGVDVARHVEGVADARHERAVAPAALERLRAVLIIPVVDAIVMRSRVVRVDGQDLANQELRAHTVLGHRFVGVKRFRLHVVGILDDQALERVLEVLARGVALDALLVLHFPRGDVVALALRAALFPAGSLAQERAGAIAIRGARQPPIGHRRVRIELDRPPERALGLEEPERMEERVPLIEPLLDFRLRSRDREGRSADALDLRRAFAWTFIERFSELRVAALVALGRPSCPRAAPAPRSARRRRPRSQRQQRGRMESIETGEPSGAPSIVR